MNGRQQQNPLDALMRQLSPVLLQLWLEKQRNQMYLDRSRQSYGEYGKQQRLTQAQALQNAVWEAIMKSGAEWSKDQPMSPEVLIDVLMKYLPSNLTSQLQLPPDSAAQVAAARKAGTGLAVGQQAGAPVDPATLATVVQGYGLTPATKGAESIVKTTEKRADRAEKEKTRELREKELQVKKGTLGVREKELEVKKAGKSTESEAKKKKEKTLEKYLTERVKLEQKVSDRDMRSEPELKKKVETRISKLTGWINGLQKELGMKSDREYRVFADDLKSRGVTRGMVQSSPPFVNALQEKGWQVWVLLGYLPETIEITVVPDEAESEKK